MNPTTFDPIGIVLVLILTIVAPIVGVWDYRRLLRRLGEGRAGALLNAFVWTIVVQWVLAAGFLAWWLLSGRGLAPLRLVPGATGWQWLVIVAGVGVIVFLLLQMKSLLGNPERLEQARPQMQNVLGLAPRSTAERRAFDLVSITAGVCEEFLYRGLLLAVLSASIGTWPAVLLSSLIFGLGHSYQGWTGFGKTTVAGLVMALLAVGTGSLFVPMLVHAVGDLTSGRILTAASRVPSPRPASAA